MKIEFNCLKPKTSLAFVCGLFVLSHLLFFPYSFAQFQANISSNCENGNCTSTICINDKPCETTNSNLTNITSLDDLLKNKTIPNTNLPREII